MPMLFPVLFHIGTTTSAQHHDTSYFPLGSCDTAAFTIFPCGTNLFLVLTIPSFGNLMCLPKYPIFSLVHLLSFYNALGYIF